MIEKICLKVGDTKVELTLEEMVELKKDIDRLLPRDSLPFFSPSPYSIPEPLKTPTPVYPDIVCDPIMYTT